MNDVEVGDKRANCDSPTPAPARLTAKVAAYLPENAPPDSRATRTIPWHIEKARIADTRDVKVEAIVNGQPVAEARPSPPTASCNDVAFDGIKLDRTTWVALRIFPSSHTNPIFVLVDGKPIRASKRSAEWCLKGVDVSAGK